MIWNISDKAQLVMKNFSSSELENYLSKIDDEKLYTSTFIKLKAKVKIYFQVFQATEIQ